jgi:FdhD protein
MPALDPQPASAPHPARPAPVLSRASRPLTFDVLAVDESGAQVATAIAGEAPLTLYVDTCEIVTLMTLGQHPEALAIGYLRNQGLIAALGEIAQVTVDWEVNAVAVTTCAGIAGLSERLAKRTVTTGCGQGTVFGDMMESLGKISLPVDVQLSQTQLYAVNELIRQHETIYKAAGAVHGCALFRLRPKVEMLYFVEDVGRHNAVDAIAGYMWLDGHAGQDKLFYTTGRLTSEMVIKAAQMGMPFLVSRSGLTQMGYEIARQVGITMLGRAVNKHYLLFTGAGRFRRA